MQNVEEFAKEFLTELVQEMFEEEADSILSAFSEAQWQMLKKQIVSDATQSLLGTLPTGITGGSKYVVCVLRKNEERVSRSSAVQCQNGNCAKYFCTKHNLVRCPSCGDTVS